MQNDAGSVQKPIVANSIDPYHRSEVHRSSLGRKTCCTLSYVPGSRIGQHLLPFACTPGKLKGTGSEVVSLVKGEQEVKACAWVEVLKCREGWSFLIWGRWES